MFSNNHEVISTSMITLFIVLGTLILTIPLACLLFILSTRAKRDQRAEAIKRATLSTTTMRVGVNGRTVFKNKVSRPANSPSQARKQSPPPQPVLPYTSQQASTMSQTRTLSQRAWQRLSRPFLAAPATAPEDDDRIELHQKPVPHQSILYQNVSPVSPISQPDTSTSWNTIDHLEGPVSPPSFTNNAASSSIAETMARNPYGDKQQNQTEARNPFSDIPLTPPATRPIQRTDTVRARPTVDRNESLESGKIRENIVDRGNMKLNKIQLQQVPHKKAMKSSM